ALRLPRTGQPAGKARDPLDAGRGDDLHREVSLAVLLDRAPAAVTQVGHDAGEIGQITLAPGIDPFAVLAHDDVVDAVRIGQRRAHARAEANRSHAGPRAHLPAQPAHHVRRGRARGAEEDAVRFSRHALSLLGN